MRRGAATVQQPRRRQHERAWADRDQSGAARVRGAQGVDQPLGRALVDVAPPRDDDGIGAR